MLARLQAESSRNMYSLHGLLALMRAVFLLVCQRLTVVSYCMPGSPQCQVAVEILLSRSLDLNVFVTEQSLSVLVEKSVSRTPAFMKLSGPLAVPPPESVSVDPRSVDKFVPVPLPHLKSIPSVLARVRIESSESFTELMKQAEHWGLEYPVTPNSTFCVCGFQCQLRPSELGSMRSHPTLNQTGLLKAAYWRTRMWTSSSWKVAPSS